MASRQVHDPNSHPAIKADVTPAVCSSAAERADSGYIWYVTFPRCTHMLMSESPRPRGGGESWGEVRRLCGREYSWSIQRCSINLINGLITASKQSSEIRSRKEEEGWGRRTKAAHGQSGTVALLCLENTNRTRSSFFWGLNDHVH